MLGSDKKGAQFFASICIIANFVWVTLWTLVIWGVFDLVTYKECGYYHSLCPEEITIMGKITLVATLVSALGFFGSNVLSIKDYDQRGVLLPLKVTSVICLIYFIAYAISIILSVKASDNLANDRMAALAGFTCFIWIVTWVIVAILSNNAKTKIEDAAKKDKSKDIDNTVSQSEDD